MEGLFYDKLDIRLGLKLEELETLTENGAFLDCKLSKIDGSDSGRKVKLQCKHFDDCWSGNDKMTVEYNKKMHTYCITVSKYTVNRWYFSLDARNMITFGISVYILERNRGSFINNNLTQL